MVPTRRQTLQSLAGATAATLAGCTSLLDGESAPEYRLVVDRMDVSPVEAALYEPGDGLFSAEAAEALSAILPDGRYTTYGYEALPDDAYVAHEGAYHQVTNVVTGRERMERSLVRVEAVPEEEVPADAAALDDLDRPSERVLKILHAHALTGGEGSSDDLLHGDAYVLRRPAEREGALGSGDLDAAVVTAGGDREAYRVRRTRDRVTETEHAALTVRVAGGRGRFRRVVFATGVDAELAPADLTADARDVLREAIDRERYRETAPLSTAYESVLSRLGADDVDPGDAVNGRRLWYDGSHYRYGLYVGDGA